MSTNLITVKNLTKKFKNKIIFENVNFSILMRQKIGIVGANGAGKTTLIKILANLLPFESGTINFNNEKYLFDEIRKDIFVFLDKTETNLQQKFTLFENISFFSKLYKFDKFVAIKLAEDFGLQDSLYVNYEKLSAGTQLKAIILIGLMKEPKLLILDEPFNGIDPIMLPEISSTLSRSSQAMLISSHILSPLYDICDAFIFIKNTVLTYKTKQDIEAENRTAIIKFKGVLKNLSDSITANIIDQSTFSINYENYNHFIKQVNAILISNEITISDIQFQNSILNYI